MTAIGAWTNLNNDNIAYIIPGYPLNNLISLMDDHGGGGGFMGTFLGPWTKCMWTTLLILGVPYTHTHTHTDTSGNRREQFNPYLQRKPGVIKIHMWLFMDKSTNAIHPSHIIAM